MPKQVRPKVTFYLDTQNSTISKKAPIVAKVTIAAKEGSGRGKQVTRIIDHVHKTDWSNKTQRIAARPERKTEEHDLINEKLKKLQEDFNKFILKSEVDGFEVTAEVARQFLYGRRNFTGKPFWEAYSEYIGTIDVEPKTRQNYLLYLTKLKEFEKEKRYKIDYQTINSVFFELYKTYILSEKGLGWNTLATATKKLRFFMNWAAAMKYHNETGYKEFSCTEREPEVIFLGMYELKKLLNYDFGNKRLNQVRDRFCFGCLTGLAFADVDALKPEHINNGILVKYREKSNVKQDMVLPDAAVEILNRYQGHYKSLPRISSQKFNDYIKECCRIAGIDTPTSYKDFSGGRTTILTAPKYELVGSHTARKTFISLFYNRTKDMTLTKKFAGIEQDKTTRRYMSSDRPMERQAMKKAFGSLTKKKPGMGKQGQEGE